jgi:hypothetical protein
LCGDAPTLADIQFGHILYRYFDVSIERPSHPAIERYYDELASQAAFQEPVLVSYGPEPAKPGPARFGSRPPSVDQRKQQAIARAAQTKTALVTAPK